MPRWESGARERLREAALDLFTAQGYDGVTVAEIASAAGLTERTFFRHYADKREVLFWGQADFERVFLDGLAEAPEGEPLAMMVGALRSADSLFPEDRRTWSRARKQVIDGHAALRERELLKLAALTSSLTEGLVSRGVPAIEAAMAAEMGMAAFRRAFATWTSDDETRSFAAVQDEALHQLRALVVQGI